MSIEVGQVIGNRFQVEAFVGKGAMAEVYKVFDRQRAVSLAMKLLQADLAEDMIFLRRFRREAQTLTALQHPNIVRFYELDQQENLAFMLMDFVDGTTLRKEIFRSQGTPFQPARVLELMRMICSALHYAHQMGVIHCDIKPANIMIDPIGRVQLADFGIARMTDSATMTMAGAGTPAYMAPEQAKGLEPTPQTDVYALGIVLYEMLTGGERPFTGSRATGTGSTSVKVLWEKLNLTPLPPSHFNPALTAQVDLIVMRCLAVPTSARYSDPLDLLADLELALVTSAESNVDAGEESTFVPAFPMDFPTETEPQTGAGKPVSKPEKPAETIKTPAPSKSPKTNGSKKMACIVAVGMVFILGMFGMALAGLFVYKAQVSTKQTAGAATQVSYNLATQAEIETYQAQQAQTITARAQATRAVQQTAMAQATRAAQRTARAIEQTVTAEAQATQAAQQTARAIKQTEQTKKTAQSLTDLMTFQIIDSSWDNVMRDSFDDNHNKWCSTTADYSHLSGTYDEKASFNVLSGHLNLVLEPESTSASYRCFPDQRAHEDFYAAVETGIVPFIEKNHQKIGLYIESEDGTTYVFSILHYSVGTSKLWFFVIPNSGPSKEYLEDMEELSASFDFPAKLGVLVQGNNWTLFLNDKEITTLTMADTSAKYIGLEASLYEQGEEASYQFDQYELWVP